MKILLTGHRGFIGKHLKRRLKELKYKVKGFDIKESPLYQDIRFRENVRNVFYSFKPDIVIHLAALAGVRNSLKNPKGYFETNITGTYFLLEQAEKYKVKNFLFASSSSVYGNQKEELKEDMICEEQLSSYAVSKKAGELLCKMFDKVSTIVFRPFTVYGENGRNDMVVRKLITAGRERKTFYRYGKGDSIRGYTNVYDLVEGIVKLIDFGPKDDNFDIFNLGGDEQVQLNDLIDIVKEKYPNLKVEQVKRNPVDVINSFANIEKAKKLLNWRPIKNFKNEIRKLC